MSTIIKEISAKNPTGSDQKYEDTYLAIESEIDKTMSASNLGEVNWKFIYEQSTEILEYKSKDLKIASYWLYSQWKLSSWNGLESSLPLYTKLITTYKMKLFPKSTKVKLRILEWLHENITVAIFRDIDQLDEENFNKLLHSLEALESTIVKTFEKEDLKIFSSLIRKLKKYAGEKKSREKLNEEVESIEEKETTIVKDELIEKIEVSNYTVLEHKQELKENLSSVKSIDYLFEMTQLLGFSKFQEAFSKEILLRREEFPSDDTLAYLETLKKESTYLEELKVYVSKYPCWLEGQYLLIINGEEKEESKYFKILLNTLKYKLINFIKYNEKKIHNCMPKDYILGERLKKWVNLESKYFTIGNTNSKYEEIFQESLMLVKTKSKEEAVAMLDDIKKDSKTLEESFLWSLKQVYLALEIDNRNMAVALLYDLNKEIEYFNLEKWKPKLAIEVYVLLLKPSINKILKIEMKELIYGKLCRLRPQEAMKISFL